MPARPAHVAHERFIRRFGKGFRVVMSRDNKAFRIETTKPKELVKLLDPKILTHLLRGLLAADHVSSVHRLARLNREAFPDGSIAARRNKATLMSMIWGFMYEAGRALAALNGMRIRERLTDKGIWDDLERIRKRWSAGNGLSARVRNNVAFHLGDEEFYVAGLQQLSKRGAALVLCEVEGDDELRWDLPQRVLFEGLGIDHAKLQAFVDEAKNDVKILGNRLNCVLVDLLRQAGVRFPANIEAKDGGSSDAA